MKKFYEGILLELDLFQTGEIILTSPVVSVGDGDNHIGDTDIGLPGIGSIGDIL